MVTEGLATCSGEGATTTENTMVMAKFVSEMSNGSYFPRRAEGNLYEQSTIRKGGQTSVFYNSIGPSCQNQVAADLGQQTDRKSITINPLFILILTPDYNIQRVKNQQMCIVRRGCLSVVSVICSED